MSWCTFPNRIHISAPNCFAGRLLFFAVSSGRNQIGREMDFLYWAKLHLAYGDISLSGSAPPRKFDSICSEVSARGGFVGLGGNAHFTPYRAECAFPPHISERVCISHHIHTFAPSCFTGRHFLGGFAGTRSDWAEMHFAQN